MNKYARENGILKEKDPNFTNEDVREGLTAIISVKVPEPQFEGQTKSKLGNSEVRTITDRIFSEKFTEFLAENPNDAKSIINKCALQHELDLPHELLEILLSEKEHSKDLLFLGNSPIVQQKSR